MAVRELIKRIFIRSGFGFCLDFFRSLRFWGYGVLDFFGWIFFWVFLSLRARPLKSSEVSKILIIRLDRVGDLILSTPAIRAVRQSFPNSRIDLLVRSYTRDLVVGNPHVDRVLVYKESGLDKDYDVAIALHPGLTQNYLVFKSGAFWRVGYTGWGGGFFLTHPVKDDRAVRLRHEVVSALEVVGKIGCMTQDVSLEVSVTQRGESESRDFLRCQGFGTGNPYIVVHPGSRQAYIQWYPERFAQVADRIVRECGKRVILTGGFQERDLVARVKGLMRQEASCAIGLSLTGIISLIKGARLFIGNCTGPMHVAAALRIPVVTIIGTQHPLDSYQAWGPWNTTSAVLHKDVGCKKCHPGDCLTFACMEAITVDDVYRAAVRLLNP
jgi:heptosyltransferase-2